MLAAEQLSGKSGEPDGRLHSTDSANTTARRHDDDDDEDGNDNQNDDYDYVVNDGIGNDDEDNDDDLIAFISASHYH